MTPSPTLKFTNSTRLCHTFALATGPTEHLRLRESGGNFGQKIPPTKITQVCHQSRPGSSIISKPPMHFSATPSPPKHCPRECGLQKERRPPFTLPFIWTVSEGAHLLITGFSKNQNSVLVGKEWHSLEYMFDNFTFEDGRPFGVVINDTQHQ